MTVRIGCDLDGVIADIVLQLVNYAGKKCGITIRPEHLVSEHAETCTPLTDYQLQEFFCERSFFTEMAVFKGARDALRELRAQGFKVDIVTDRFWYPEIQADTRDWLERNEIPFDRLTFARKAEKHLVAAEHNYRFFIEDQLSNALLISNVTAVYLLDRPYNQGPFAADRVYRMRELGEVARAASLSEDLSEAKPILEGNRG